MAKLILAIVGSLVAAFAIVFATDTVFHMLTAADPMPEAGDTEALRTYVARQPVGYLLAVLIGWAIAAFIGSAIAARFGGRGAWPGWVVASLFLLATIANFAMVPHPVWMVVVGIALILAAGWLGARTGAANRVAAPARP